MCEDKVIVYLSGSKRAYTGPIRSMNTLCKVLSERFKVISSSNLLGSEIFETVVQENFLPPQGHLLKVVKRNFVYGQLRDLYFALKMNIEILVLSYSYKPKAIIITQPWLLVIRSSILIYIRRVNLPETKIVSSSPLLKLFEWLFFRVNKKMTVVYLCPQADRSKKFIFNSFDFGNSDFDNISVNPSCFMIGTFINRKGSRLFSDFATQLPHIRFAHIGSVPETICEYVEHLGTTNTPYAFTEYGDILVSVSKVEGFQRTLVEAINNGMFLICNRREDTLVLSDLPSVFFIEDITDFVRAYEDISQMSISEKRRILKVSLSKVRSLFSHEAVLQQWVSLIEKC